MNKKLIAVAVAAAFAAPMAASADATIYGAIDTAITFNDVERFGTTLIDNTTVDTNDGALGIKGSEDLGNGLSAVYKFEINFDSDNGAISGTADEVWVGLASDYGVVALGREDHPYKNVLNASGYNPFGDRLNDLDAMTSRVGGVGFRQETTSNGLVYISPNFSGFSGQAALVAIEGSGNATSSLNDGFDAYSLGVNYKGGGLAVGLAYEDIDAFNSNAGAGVDGSKSWVVAGSYTFGDFKFGVGYEDTEDARQNSTGLGTLLANDVETLGVAATYTFGNNVVGISYVDEEQEGVNGVVGQNADIDGWGVNFAHNLSNRTQVYATYADSENDATVAAQTRGATIGTEDKVFEFGLVHSF